MVSSQINFINYFKEKIIMDDNFKLYSAIKKLLFKHNVVFNKSEDYEKFIKDLARMLSI